VRLERSAMRLMRRNASEDIAAGIVEVVSFDVYRAWKVDGLDDLGPGFLFETPGHEFVYAATQRILDIEPAFPRRQITIERLPASKSILNVRSEGNQVTSKNTFVSIHDLPVFGDCEVFRREAISDVVSEKLGLR